MKHIRFDTWLNDTWVRLALKDGEVITHKEGGRTEEGYSHSTIVFERDGHEIECRTEHSASDCDGPLYSYWDAYACPALDGFKYQLCDGEYRKRLIWREEQRSQRDIYAEQMGY